MRDGALSPRARSALVASLVVVAVATLVLAFHGDITANPGSRLLTVFGLVEGGSLRADRWFDLTIDRAIVDRHVYSDKAPLSSFVVVPFYAAWRLFERGEQSARDLQAAVFLGDAVASAIPLGVFTWLVARRASRGMAPREAIAVALFATLGTPLLSYGGTYFGHVLSGTLFVFAYDAAVQARPEDADRRALLSGVLVGLAVLAELPIALGGAALAFYWLAGEKGWQRLARYLAGGFPCAVAMGLYNAKITGSPLDPPYRHLTSTFYIASPYTLDRHTLDVARALLVGQYRGLFFYAPALLVLVPLAIVYAPNSRRRHLLVGYALIHFLFVASFWVWHGGWCIGPRHLTPLIMLFAYEGVDALARSSPFVRPVFFGLASAGVALNLVAVSTNPFVETTTHPFTDLYWPALARGEMTPHSFFADLGLSLGPATLAVWAAAFLFTSWGLGQAARWGAGDDR